MINFPLAQQSGGANKIGHRIDSASLLIDALLLKLCILSCNQINVFVYATLEV